jgi:hypothetical protein
LQYADVYIVAKQEYQMQFAKLVKEYYDATVRAHPGAFTRPPQFPQHIGSLWHFCAGAPRAQQPKTAVLGLVVHGKDLSSGGLVGGCVGLVGFRPGQVVPMPFNLVEHALDLCMKGHAQRRALRKGPEEAWGRHYTWPPSMLEQRLVMAVRKQRIRREIQGEKAKS